MNCTEIGYEDVQEGSSGSCWRLATVSCEKGNEPLGSIKVGAYFDQLSDYHFPKTDSAQWSHLHFYNSCSKEILYYFIHDFCKSYDSCSNCPPIRVFNTASTKICH
jgi:hypothetical protein